jgi:peptidyl-Lys metalloendopeptidase
MRAPLKISLFVGLLLILLTARATAKLPDGIRVIVNMENTQLSSKQDILIDTTFINTTQATINLLKWQIPTSGILHENLFNITNSLQETIKYQGKIYKRLAPQANDFLVLKAGEKVSIRTNLSLSYALTKSGFYTITYKHQKYSLGKPSHPYLSFTLLEDRPQKGLLQGIQKAAVKGCSSRQESRLEDVLLEASKTANLSALLLSTIKEENRPYAKRYTQWFGGYDSERYKNVVSNFKTFQTVLENKEISFNCDCNESAIAYVFPEVAYKIHLCTSFWDLDLNGTDSQAGTIIHELSHFKVTAHTDDHVYGKLRARQLATETPNTAINNADNYEYFAENSNPYFPMYRAGLADRHEPDNSKATAKLILSDSSQVYSINTKGDEDWSSFKLFFASYVNLFVNGPENGDTEITLYDTNGKKIASNDDRDSTNNESYSEISKDSLPAGTYYVKVNGYKKNTIVQEYQLALTVLPEGSNKNQDSKKSAKGSFQWPLLLILLLSYFIKNNYRQQKYW